MSRKRKYSDQLRLEVVQRYLNGNVSFKDLAKEYKIGKSDIIKWRDAYIEHGEDGLIAKKSSYSGDFKIQVVEYMYNTGSSFRKTAAHFNIPSYSTVRRWKQIYNNKGAEFLS